MGRILSIDYGMKRVGLAVTDPMKIIANGMCTLSVKELPSFLISYIPRENVETIVLGWPMNLNNTPSEAMQFVAPFSQWLEKQFTSIPLVRYDERFTSSMAHRAMIDGGLKKMARRNKALVDEISATILLQSYLESLRIKNS